MRLGGEKDILIKLCLQACSNCRKMHYLYIYIYIYIYKKYAKKKRKKFAKDKFGPERLPDPKDLWGF